MSHLISSTNHTAAKKSPRPTTHVSAVESISAEEGGFLNLLRTDIVNNPQNLRPVTQSWKSELDELVGDMDVDLDGKG